MGLQAKVYYFYHLRKNLVLKRLFSILLIISFSICTAFAPPEAAQVKDTNAKLKAVFIYNFTKYIEWPSSFQTGEFTIGILGEYDALYSRLDEMSKVKKVANQSFSIRTFNDISEVEKPHILYIPNSNADKLNKAVNKLKGQSTLIVTEKAGLATQGSIINFVFVGSSQKFELNKATAEQHNLKVAASLEKLAIMIN